MVGDHSAEDYALDQVKPASSDDLALLKRLNPDFMDSLSQIERISITHFLLGKSYQEISKLLGHPAKKTPDNALQRVRNRAQKLGPSAVILEYDEVT